ncbi:hypothetical protein KK083_04795 [Fulvivirgaceae bacterium PWU4]|uniref:Uncharacterized protein n=1 Tax=Chryseosolibacter histidini TaxID=2782349 RepID=A0AAP2DLK5_9BACT|nr:hypothetical protein [Chryseosolibacter histidini]MBT1696179.1 hypothetical protein [Chryseosolibacter histidini]
MSKITLTSVFSMLQLLAVGQTPLDVAESTIKVGALSEEVFYYGFAAGDELIFNFEEVKGKELKELEIIELPGTSKFMDYKAKRISNKILHINRTGIYKFRFANSALVGRICRFRLQRIPTHDSTKNFNTSVYWKTIHDTTYIPFEERYLAKSDTIATTMEQLAKVSSQNALNGNRNNNVVEYELPPGTTSWSYYIGVGNAGKAEYERAKNKFVNTAAAQLATISGYGAMAALALHGINTFVSLQGGADNVKYWFISDWNNVLAFKAGNQFMQYKQGDVVNDAAQMKNPLTGKIYLGLLNDNILQAIDVHVRITAIQVNQIWSTRTVNKVQVSSRQVAFLAN